MVFKKFLNQGKRHYILNISASIIFIAVDLFLIYTFYPLSFQNPLQITGPVLVTTILLLLFLGIRTVIRIIPSRYEETIC